MPGRTLVRRVEDRLIEKWITQVVTLRKNSFVSVTARSGRLPSQRRIYLGKLFQVLLAVLGCQLFVEEVKDLGLPFSNIGRVILAPFLPPGGARLIRNWGEVLRF